MCSVLRTAALAAVLLFGAERVRADSVYDVTGTFGTDLFGGNSGLAGGSFTATVDVVEPVNGSLVSYTVSTFNSMGTLVYSYGDPTGGNGFIGDFGSGGIGVGLGDPTPNSSAFLALNFAPGFTGTGPVVPTNLNSDFPSIYSDPYGNYVSIASGYSSLAVPEPSSLILAGLAAMGSLGVWARRHRASRA